MVARKNEALNQRADADEDRYLTSLNLITSDRPALGEPDHHRLSNAASKRLR